MKSRGRVWISGVTDDFKPLMSYLFHTSVCSYGVALKRPGPRSQFPRVRPPLPLPSRVAVSKVLSISEPLSFVFCHWRRAGELK